MKPEEFKVKTVGRGGSRQHEVSTCQGLRICVDVDEEGYLRYESSRNESSSSEDGSDGSDLSAAETVIQSAILLALRPQRRTALEAIEVLWTKEGSIVVCVKLDLPYALKLMDLYLRSDSTLNRLELSVLGVSLVTAAAAVEAKAEETVAIARAAQESLAADDDDYGAARLEQAIAAVVAEQRTAPERLTLRLAGHRVSKLALKKKNTIGGSVVEPLTMDPIVKISGPAIADFGFCECRQLLPQALCGKLAAMPMRNAEGISNAFQKSVEGALLREALAAIEASATIKSSMFATFGTSSFRVTNVKVLMAEFGQLPQIPHADDYCNRELFGIAHLLPEQLQTQAVPYDPDAPYPSGVQAQCDACGAWCELPDKVCRRREHLDRPGYPPFTCRVAGLPCKGSGAVPGDSLPVSPLRGEPMAEVGAVDAPPLVPLTRFPSFGINRQPSAAKYDLGKRQQDLGKLNAAGREDGFARDLVASFGDLLWRPGKTIEQMRPMGAPPEVGDGIVCLPTLVHRGPGGNDERKVLFFSVKPIYEGFGPGDGDVGEYDADAQIHAGWLLWRSAHIIEEPEAILRAYEGIGYSLLHFGQGEKVVYTEDRDSPPKNRQRASEELRADREFMLAAVQRNGGALSNASEELRADREVVLAAVQQNGGALQHASEELKADREFMLAAVQQRGMALQYASEELKADREIVLAAVQQNGGALEHASQELRADREFMLAAVQRNGYALLYASEELRADREVVLAAVQQSSVALHFASEELKADREILLAAVQQNGWALAYASQELKADREIVLAAVQQNGLTLRYASAELRAETEQGGSGGSGGSGGKLPLRTEKGKGPLRSGASSSGGKQPLNKAQVNVSAQVYGSSSLGFGGGMGGGSSKGGMVGSVPQAAGGKRRRGVAPPAVAAADASGSGSSSESWPPRPNSCLPGCVAPHKGLHHLKCPNYGVHVPLRANADGASSSAVGSAVGVKSGGGSSGGGGGTAATSRRMSAPQNATGMRKALVVHNSNVQSPNPGVDMMHGMMQSLAGGFSGGAGGGSMPSAYPGRTSGGYMGSQMPGGAGAVGGGAFAGMLPQYQHGPSCSSSGASGAGLCGGMHPSMLAPARDAKASNSLAEIGFALRPVSSEQPDLFRALAGLLVTQDPSQLGKGKDVQQRYGPYDNLKLRCAWRIEHPVRQAQYQAAVSGVGAEMEKLRRTGVQNPPGLPAPARGFQFAQGANERMLLHGTSPERLLDLLANGLNERFSGVNAGSAFGDGIYLTEDVGKTDQYVAADPRYDASLELHRRLYGGNTVRHPGDVFYVLACRVALGHSVRTQHTGEDACAMDGGHPIFPVTFRELAPIPGITPTMHYHSLIAELGGAIQRYREFVVFKGTYVYPEFLLAYQRYDGSALLRTW